MRCAHKLKAIPHDSKCRYGERGAADAKPKAQIILDAAKVSAASGGNSEPKQGQRSQSARGFCPRSTMRVPQPDIIEHFGNADAVPQLPEWCLSRKAGIVRCCLKGKYPHILSSALHSNVQGFFITAKKMKPIGKLPKHFTAGTSGDCRCSGQCRQLAGVFALSRVYNACPSSKAAVPAFEKNICAWRRPIHKSRWQRCFTVRESL